MTTFYLISSAFLHALWNALSKKSAQPQMLITGILLLATAYSLCFSVLVYFVPMAPFGGAPFPTTAALAWGLASGVCEAGYFITLGLALTRAPVGMAYIAMRGAAMLLVYAFSATFLRERFNLTIASGIALALVGLVLSARISPAAQRQKRQLAWSYACAVSISGYHLCYARALSAGANPSWLFTLSLCLAVPVLLLFNRRRGWQQLRVEFERTPATIVVGGLICTVSFLLYLLGLSHSGAGQALVLRNLSILFAQMFALMIGEEVRVTQWLGAIAVALGASLVSLG